MSPNEGFIDETIIKNGNPIPYDEFQTEYKEALLRQNVFITPPANGLLVEEIAYDDYLAVLEEWRRKNKQAEE